MSRSHSDEFKAADTIVMVFLFFIFSLVAGIVNLFKDGLTRLPQGIPVGYIRTNLGFKRRVGILSTNTFKHTAIVGPTGSGKTTLLVTILTSYMEMGYGVALIDPKGDMLDTLLSLIPPSRVADVVILDPTDTRHPVGISLFDVVSPDMAPRSTSELLSIFKKVLGSSWGHRMEHVLRSTLLVLFERDNSNLSDMRSFLLDPLFREMCLESCTNPTVLSYWRDEFSSYTQAQQQQVVAPILNRLGFFLSYPVVRNMFSMRRGTLSIDEILNSQKIFLVSLPATLGEDVASFVGSVIVSKFQIATLQRASLPISQRRAFVIAIDEAQHFVSTDSFERIITEARSMKVGFILATQFIERFPATLRQTIVRNVATFLTCYHEYGRYQVLYQQLQDAGSPNIVVTPYPPAKAIHNTQYVKALRRESRRKYARSRASVERELGNITPQAEIFTPEPFWS